MDYGPFGLGKAVCGGPDLGSGFFLRWFLLIRWYLLIGWDAPERVKSNETRHAF